MKSKPKQVLGKGIKKPQPKKINPAAVAKYLQGLSYPTDKKSLLVKASMNRATDDVLHVMNKMEDKTYRTMVAILEEVSHLWVDPDYKIQATGVLVKGQGSLASPKAAPPPKYPEQPKKDYHQEAKEKSSVETGQAQKPFVDKNKARRLPPPLLLKLYDLFPKVFDLNNPKPLKRGIHKDILERLPDDLAVTESHLKKAMKRHVMGSPYCWAILKGTHRFDLDGNEVDVIDEQGKESAQSVIKWKREMRQQQKAQSAKKETGGVT